MQILTFDRPAFRIGVLAPSRDYLAGYLAGMAQAVGISTPSEPYLKLEQACGRVYTFESERELPEQTLPCRCGDPQCLVIEYRRD